MCDNRKWEELFDLKKRESESDFSQKYMDLALAIQQITEQMVLRLAQTARDLTNCSNLVMAGGVALNCVANGALARSKIFEKIWIQPAAGDAGGALGAAYAGHHIWNDNERQTNKDGSDKMAGSYLGPSFSEIDIHRLCRRYNAPYKHFDNFIELSKQTAKKLADSKIVGWFQGRMEWGPRSLGCRSILGDPRHPETQKRLNLKIKYREGFRPFAPSVLAEEANNYFEIDCDSPYMLHVAPVRESIRKPLPDNYNELELYDRLYQVRSEIPAITHVDFSARIQTVHKETNPRYWQLIDSFKNETGCGLVVNTSFNVRGEPIVCTPEDAYQCFMRTEMDYLVIGNYLFSKSDQPKWQEKESWRDKYVLD